MPTEKPTLTMPPTAPQDGDAPSLFAARASEWVEWFGVSGAPYISQAAEYVDESLTTIQMEHAAAVTGLAEIQAERDAVYGLAQDVASAIAYQDLTAMAADLLTGTVVAVTIDTTPLPMSAQVGRSWFAEPLGTSTRGTRRDFPTVKLVVCTDNDITIFDCDGPTPTMWMIFQRGSGKFVLAPPRSVAMCNGALVAGNDEGSALFEIDFAADGARWVYSPGIRCFDEPISGRNASGWTQGPSSGGIAGNFVHSVALPVLPGAPTNIASGLPKPTIVAGTDGGVSVIAPDGEVKNSSFASQVKDLAIIDEHIWFTYGGSTSFPVRVSADKISDLSAGWSDTFYKYAAGVPVPPLVHSSINALASGWRGAVVYSGTKGAGVLVPDHNTQSQGLVSLMTSTYATGWMVGDIKLATLCETEAGVLTDGGELVTNGEFDTDLAGWTPRLAGGASATWNSGTARLITADSGDAVLDQALTTEVGVDYVLTLSIEGISGPTNSLIRLGLTPGAVQNGNSTIGLSGIYSITFRATATTTWLSLYNYYNGASEISVDNVSVRRAVLDRSVNDKSLQVVGSDLAYASVATGAELCAVSGFSGTSYLMQPYNAGLDFGTGDFCVAGWCKHTGTGCIVERFSSDGGDTGYQVYIDGNGVAINIKDAGVSKIASGARPDGWSAFCGVRQGNSLLMYINGKLRATTAGVSAIDVSGLSPVLSIGQRVYNSSYAFGGSLSLLRITATAPTPDQIRHMYETERRLFQPGAACTLGGAADAVTGLAYDDLLQRHTVLQADGINTFDGLTRVDWTPGTFTKIASGGGFNVRA